MKNKKFLACGSLFDFNNLIKSSDGVYNIVDVIDDNFSSISTFWWSIATEQAIKEIISITMVILDKVIFEEIYISITMLILDGDYNSIYC